MSRNRWRFPFPSVAGGRDREFLLPRSGGGTPPRQPAGRRRYGRAYRVAPASRRLSGGRPAQPHDSSSVSSNPSLVSCTGDEITYAPLAHFPRSITRQRSLQKGKSGSLLFTGFLQVGQCSFSVRFRAITSLSIPVRNDLFLDDLFLNDLSLNDPGHKIVVVGFGDLTAVESAGLRFDTLGYVVDEYFA